jgi:DNA-binding NtrC family response regulator
MDKRILVLDANEEQCRLLCKLLDAGQYPALPLNSVENLEESIQKTGCLAVFWDIDTVSVDNRTLKELTLKFPGVYFFCLSAQPFHPELQDAICYHIYACINRPVDPDELFYWLRSIDDDDADSKNQPRT